MEGRNNVPLLEFLASHVGCISLSDLQYIGRAQRIHLARVLARVPAQAAAMKEWSDALAYLAQAPPASDAESARLLLAACLSDGGEGFFTQKTL